MMYLFFWKRNFRGANQYFEKERGHRLQLKYIKLKLAKAQGGGGGKMPPSNPLKTLSNDMYSGRDEYDMNGYSCPAQPMKPGIGQKRVLRIGLLCNIYRP